MIPAEDQDEAVVAEGLVAKLQALGMQPEATSLTRERLTFMRRIQQAFLLGWQKGVRDFAIWRDGEQLVGCRQRPLGEVLAEGPRGPIVEEAQLAEGPPQEPELGGVVDTGRRLAESAYNVLALCDGTHAKVLPPHFEKALRNSLLAFEKALKESSDG